MSAYRRKDRGNRWHYRRVVQLPDGSKKRIRGPAPINTKRAAEEAERTHVERLLHPERFVKKSKTPTLAVFSRTFLDTYVATQNKPRVQRDKKRILETYLLPELGRKPLNEISVLDIERLRAKLLATREQKHARTGREAPAASGRSRKTVNNIMGVLSRLFNYAQEAGVIESVPRVKKLKTEAPDFRFLDDNELQALLAVSSKEPFWHAAVLLGCDAGLRMGELRGLRWSDWSKREGRLHIQRSADKETNEMGPTKGWGRRKIPLTGRLEAALKAIRRPCELVLCDVDAKMLSYEKFRWNLPRLLRAAEVAPGTWHDMRHTFCSHLAMKGAPAKVIQELAGHTELSTTLKYMHLTDGAREDAIALLDLDVYGHQGVSS